MTHKHDNSLDEALHLRQILGNDSKQEEAFAAFIDGARNGSTKPKSETVANPGNMLYDIHTLLNGLSIAFKESYSQQCNISTPTYYRQMRPSYKIVNDKKVEVPQSFSNAEKYMIRKVLDDIFKGFCDFYVDFRAATE
ncbi:hypothetical protein FHW36_112136 [Chitinophaga polysaccharea]|uniref:Uncharacterized protein n=1 Tax=Chitinophaga polysaccharea TaxID=1293035 RepID=A0A561P6F1_9BACT|nr:hypothetical protein [Chitinophaga polysaccharea]TWF33695.1 hypothetical protein FHW36_112136 [Chitinophaga polysaccharea]